MAKYLTTTLTAVDLEALRASNGLVIGLEYQDSTNNIRYKATSANTLIIIQSFIQRVAGVIKSLVSGDIWQFGTDVDNTTFEADGTMKMNGAATNYRDELGDALGLKTQGPGVAVNAAEGTLEFAANADLNDYAYKNVQFNHDRKLAAIVFPHFHFFQTSAVMPNFMIQYRYQKQKFGKTTAWTNLKMNTPAETYVSGVLNQIVGTVAGIQPPAGDNVSDILQVRILRDTGNASGLFAGVDGLNAVVGCLSFDVHIQFDTLGSHQEYIK